MIFLSLNVFQWVFVAGIVVLFAVLLVATARQKLRRREALLWGVVLLAAATAVIWPPVTSYAAQLFGIGRGADLLLYLAVIGMFVGFWMVYMRLRQLRREMTLLVRHHAIEQALRAETAGGADAENSANPSA